MNSFFNELNRRNVTRVALLYGGISWLLIQIAETVLPVFDVSTQVLRWLIIALAVGFIAAVVLSWLYDVTPDGVRRDDPTAASEESTVSSRRRMNIAIAFVLALAAGAFFVGRSGYLERGDEDALPVANAIVEAASTLSIDNAVPLASGVAVLPFENLSDAPENAFFATGVHDEILSNLAAIRDFRVISRTSVRGYADTRLRVSDIAQQLGVSHIMEGSVRRSQDRVRVTVLLIDAVTDQPVWSESYDRTLLDVLDIQTEIARNIVFNIKGELSDDESSSISARSTANSRAYDLFLKARIAQQTNVRQAGVLDEPLALIESALELDPTFVDAWVELVSICGGMVWWDRREYRSCAADGVAQLETLAPDSPQYAFARGIYLYRVEADFAGALEVLQPVTAALPNDANLWSYVGFSARRLSRWDVALDALRKVVLLSPQDASAQNDLIITLVSSGDRVGAMAAAEAAMQRFPDNLLFPFLRADFKRKYQGDLTNYAATLREIPPELRSIHGNIWIDGVFSSQEARMAWLEEALQSGYSLQMRNEGAKGRFHRLEGRTEQAAVHFAEAYRLVRIEYGENWEQGSLFVQGLVAMAAANAGDVTTARRALALYQEATEKTSDQMPELFHDFVVYAYAALGDIDRAWQEIEVLMERPFGITVWDLKQDLELRFYFADHPGYRALVEQQ